MTGRLLVLCSSALLVACNRDPGELEQTVDYRDGLDGGPNSGERGTVKITEVLWSGSVQDDGTWDPSDVYIELRNESNRSINLSDWRLEIEGAIVAEWRIPTSDLKIAVGQEIVVAHKTTGCFPEPDLVMPDLRLPLGDSFQLTLKDADERLMEGVGDASGPPLAGGYDFVTSRSMERINLMFGGEGMRSQSWHYYNKNECPADILAVEGNEGLFCYQRLPNNDRIKPGCRRHTLGSPGRPNSPDYSGAYASGSFE